MYHGTTGIWGPALEARERYKKIVADTARLDALLVELFLDWHGSQAGAHRAGRGRDGGHGGGAGADREEDPAALGLGWRSGGVGVQGLPLSDAGQLEPGAARALYEEVYCARGDMENRIKQQQLARPNQRQTPSLLAALTKHLHGFAAPPYGAMPIQPLQTDQTPQNLRLLRRSG